jgi:hypothetical protein
MSQPKQNLLLGRYRSLRWRQPRWPFLVLAIIAAGPLNPSSLLWKFVQPEFVVTNIVICTVAAIWGGARCFGRGQIDTGDLIGITFSTVLRLTLILQFVLWICVIVITRSIGVALLYAPLIAVFGTLVATIYGGTGATLGAIVFRLVAFQWQTITAQPARR